MGYKKGDKFVIEIENIFANTDIVLYKIKSFNTLVFDDRGLDRLELIHKIRENWCDDCEYGDVPYGQYPCEECGHYHDSKYKPKVEGIQVGDEVKFASTSPYPEKTEYGIVIRKHSASLEVIDSDSLFRVWREKDCTRTGKTYPEVIKAFESLPKE